MSSHRTHTALTTAAVSFATLTLIPWAFEASRTQRALLVAGALPLAVLFGAIASWTPPGSSTSTASTALSCSAPAGAPGPAVATSLALTPAVASTAALSREAGPAGCAPPMLPAPPPDLLEQPDPLERPAPVAARMVSWAQLPPQLRAALAAGRAHTAPRHTSHFHS
ncbi:hypothetical protein [Kineococcus sp. SYSU DK005]|uniref:hypothetical protein n=1 Tax=Kineococcus sp. SYSU DK005 TaxID=3383126 RepID=UPI003D7CC7B5